MSTYFKNLSLQCIVRLSNTIVVCSRCVFEFILVARIRTAQ